MVTKKMEKNDWKFETRIRQPKNIEELFEDVKFIKSNKGIEYANVPCVIDIETSSFYDNEEKRAIMYAFVLGINGKCIIGRYYAELKIILKRIVEHFELTLDRRMIFYIHNLSYEFQWFSKHFDWDKVFSIEERKPLFAVTTDGIEFRCSYLLSGYSLAKVGDNLTKYKVSKMVGDLDYSLIRTPKTPLTDKELGYILNDGLVVMSYIQEQIESHYNNITLLPLTKTGEVRNLCRKRCLYSGHHHKDATKYKRYATLMKNIPVVDINEYNQLKRAFHGGFTHASGFYVNTTKENVASFDFTSSYPSVMVAEKFPMSRGEEIEITSEQEFNKNLRLYCCLFDIELFDIEPKLLYDHPISYSKCVEAIEPHIDNGRLISAKRILLTVTEQDYYVIRDFYKWSKITIRNFRRYRKGYLPKDFVLTILNLYKNKTTLKGVKGKEAEYMVSKENLNSCFGMCVTDICRDTIEYVDDVWSTKENTEDDLQKALIKYNNNKRRFLCYQWGVWVTAYAQRNLFTGIKEFGYDYIYSDTDSLKVMNKDKHMDYINSYNRDIQMKLRDALFYRDIDLSYLNPKTIKGEIKPLGVWDYEETYKKFKTLGAKRYMVQKEDGEYSLTVSGLNKKIVIPYMLKTYGDRIMDEFKDGLYIPKGQTGKNIHTYIDEETDGYVTDYLGKEYHYHELSSIHMEPCDYELSLTREFLDFIMEIQLKVM